MWGEVLDVTRGEIELSDCHQHYKATRQHQQYALHLHHNIKTNHTHVNMLVSSRDCKEEDLGKSLGRLPWKRGFSGCDDQSKSKHQLFPGSCKQNSSPH